MYITTEAIVFQLYPYKDKSAIVKLYCGQLGLVSCWVSSLHSKKSKTKAANLQPFSIIKAEIGYKEGNSLAKLKEISLSLPTGNIHRDIEKSSIALFLSELLMHCIKEASPDQPLFSFVKEAICLLNNTEEKCSNFHLLFLIRLCENLGLLPLGSYTLQTPYFNLEESIYQGKKTFHPNYLEPIEAEWLSVLTKLPIEQFHVPHIPVAVRKNLLKRMLHYYVLHTGMTPLKSHQVLEEIF